MGTGENYSIRVIDLVYYRGYGTCGGLIFFDDANFLFLEVWLFFSGVV